MLRKITVFILLISIIFAMSSANALSKPELYDAALDELEAYLNDMESMEINDLFMLFSELGSYEMSSQFMLYTSILASVEREDYGQVYVFVELLRNNEEFCNYLVEEERFGTIEELECYVRGRQEQLNGNSATACEYYNGCLSYMDSTQRVLSLQVANLEEKYQEALRYYGMNSLEGYENAYVLFDELAQYNYENSMSLRASAETMRNAYAMAMQVTPTPSPTEVPTETEEERPTPALTPAPTSTPVQVVGMLLEVAYGSSASQLSWSNVDGAVEYRVYRANGKDNAIKEFECITTTCNTTYSDTQVQKGIYSSYRIEAVDTSGTVIGQSSVQSVYAASWSPWSAWSVNNNRQATASTQVEHKVQYRSRSIDREPQYSDWSVWSSWSETRRSITDAATMQEEADTMHKWWAAKCINCGRHNPYHGSSSKCYGCGIILKNGQGLWTTVLYYSSDSSGSRLDGRSNGRIYNGNRYWLTSETKTVYRYRTRTMDLVPTYGTWSSWQDQSISETATRDVETRIVYRYRQLQ